MQKIANYQTGITVGKPIAPSQKAAQAPQVKDGAFARELRSASISPSPNVKFSKHALQRMHSRGVELTSSQLERLSAAMDSAQQKGARETLVLTDDAAFVVSPASRMVISAFDRENLREGVFTQIDSAVIL